MDKFLFGTYPTIWCQQFYCPWLDEVMNLFYCGYYFLMPGIVITFLIKRDYRFLIFSLSLVSFTYLGSFILYFLFPTLSPAMASEISVQLSNSSTKVFMFSSLTKWFQSQGGIIGGALPSSHVFGWVIWSLILVKKNRKIGLPFALMIPGVAISTVYLGYHHAMDPLTGIIWGYVCYRLVEPRCRYLIDEQNSIFPE